MKHWTFAWCPSSLYFFYVSKLYTKTVKSSEDVPIYLLQGENKIDVIVLEWPVYTFLGLG